MAPAKADMEDWWLACRSRITASAGVVQPWEAPDRPDDPAACTGLGVTVDGFRFSERSERTLSNACMSHLQSQVVYRALLGCSTDTVLILTVNTLKI